MRDSTGSSLRICWDHIRGCGEAGPPPSMPRVAFPSINPNEDAMAKKAKKARRRRRPRSRRTSNLQARAEPRSARAPSMGGNIFAKRRALSPPFDFWGSRPPRHCLCRPKSDPRAAASILRHSGMGRRQDLGCAIAHRELEVLRCAAPRPAARCPTAARPTSPRKRGEVKNGGRCLKIRIRRRRYLELRHSGMVRRTRPQMRYCASGNLRFYDVQLHIVAHRFAMPRNDGGRLLRRYRSLARTLRVYRRQ